MTVRRLTIPRGESSQTSRLARWEAIQGLWERSYHLARLVGASEQFCAQGYHRVAQLSKK